MAQLQKLQAKLQDAQQDLRDTEYDRYISDQQNMLDKLYDEYSELIEVKLEQFMKLVKEATTIADQKRDIIISYLNGIAGDNGYAAQYKDVLSSTETIQSTVSKIVTGIEVQVADLNQKVEEKFTQDNPEYTNNGTGNSTSGSANANNQATNKSATEMTYIQKPISSATYVDENGTEHKVKTYKAKKFIKSNAKTAKKAKSTYNAVNQLIYDFTNGKVLSDKKLKELVDMFGIPNNLIKNYNKKSELYKILKSMGFANGGIVSSLNSAIKHNGDDGLATVKVGEAILTPVQTAIFSDFVDNLPTANHMTELANSLVNLPNLDTKPVNNIDYGGVTFDINVYNPADADAIVKEIQNSQKLQRSIQAVSIDRLNGKGKLSVNSIR